MRNRCLRSLRNRTRRLPIWSRDSEGWSIPRYGHLLVRGAFGWFVRTDTWPVPLIVLKSSPTTLIPSLSMRNLPVFDTSHAFAFRFVTACFPVGYECAL